MQDWARLLTGLQSDGYLIWPEFLEQSLVKAAAGEARSAQQQGQFQRAGVGRGADFQTLNEVRRDQILWLNSESGPAAQSILSLMDEVMEQINSAFFLGLWEAEFHYSIYEPGSFYRRHRDVFRDEDSRLVSVVLYLNEEKWPADGGGQIVLYPTGKERVEVPPEGGTMVCFLSREIEHEVQETHRERISCTGWMKRRSGSI